MVGSGNAGSVLVLLRAGSIQAAGSLWWPSLSPLAEHLEEQLEKMLMARGTARDEAQKLHRKWLKHRAFMVELACNKEWLAKIELVSRGGEGWRDGGMGGQEAEGDVVERLEKRACH